MEKVLKVQDALLTLKYTYLNETAFSTLTVHVFQGSNSSGGIFGFDLQMQ